MLELLKQNQPLWELFTRAEEYAPRFLDQYQRFPSYSSTNQDISQPWVSTFLNDNGLHPHYPDGKGFAVCLTHDIDILTYNLWRWPYETALAWRAKRWASVLRLALHKFNRRINPLWNFSEIMELEARYDATSTFFFLALAPGDQDFSYQLNTLSPVLREISSRGWEVGLHGGHSAYLNFDDLKRQKNRLEGVLGQPVTGYRNHYLRFAVPTTWNLLADAGFSYDATLGYAERLGFRNGMCHPYRPYDRRREQYLDILEIPLAIMDCTLTEYLRLDQQQAWTLTKQLLDTVEKHHGVISILWHNNYLFDQQLAFYEKILAYCHQKNAWLTSGREIADWWSKNNFLKQDHQ